MLRPCGAWHRRWWLSARPRNHAPAGPSHRREGAWAVGLSGLVGSPARRVGLGPARWVKPRHIFAERPLTGSDRLPVIRQVLVFHPDQELSLFHVRKALRDEGLPHLAR